MPWCCAEADTGEPALKPIFDSAWRTRAIGGEPAAIQLLADVALTPLYLFCLYRVGRNHHLCEEVVQETLVQAIRDIRQYDPPRSVNNIFGWLTGLARNHIHRVLARENASVSLEALWARMDRELLDVYARLDSEPFSDEVLQREETRQMVNTTMSQLPLHYREALEAKYVAGRSVREIAAASSISEKAVESLLTRAREAFRATFVALARNLNVEPVINGYAHD
jgi:RNA polymerase sigma-70 factor (ECF subfamily)